jgi:hypothetical protein
MCDRAGLFLLLTYDHRSSSPRSRHSSLQTSTTSIIYFGQVLAATFALLGILQYVLPKFAGFCVDSTYEEGVLYALTKERDVKCWAYTHIGNSDCIQCSAPLTMGSSCEQISWIMK